MTPEKKVQKKFNTMSLLLAEENEEKETGDFAQSRLFQW